LALPVFDALPVLAPDTAAFVDTPAFEVVAGLFAPDDVAFPDEAFPDVAFFAVTFFAAAVVAACGAAIPASGQRVHKTAKAGKDLISGQKRRGR
jgi:hypothetical protein